MASLQPGRAVTVKGVVAAAGWVNPRYGKGYFEAMLDDGSAVVPCRWFGAHYLADQLHKGDALVVYGKVSTYRKKPVLQHPEFERLGAEGEATLHTDRVVPIYALTEDLSQRVLRRIQFSAVEAYAGFVEDMLPASLREKRDLLDAETAVRQAHFPETMQDAQRARLRLVYDEFFCLQLILAIRKLQSERVANGIVHRPEGKLRERLERGLPFKLTGAQRRVIGELRTDMAKPFPMHRLLQGDVGSGKTVVAACALVDAVECGSQVAIMSPTEVLAAQHHQTFRDLVGRAGVPVAFLTGDVKGRKREHLLRDIAGGAAPVVVGTHALIQQGVEFKKLGLAIIDEQHRFGVE
jgi:ATP-dependent DNA helicase RecG